MYFICYYQYSIYLDELIVSYDYIQSIEEQIAELETEILDIRTKIDDNARDIQKTNSEFERKALQEIELQLLKVQSQFLEKEVNLFKEIQLRNAKPGMFS